MSDLADELKRLAAGEPYLESEEIEAGLLCLKHAPTILAGLAALEADPSAEIARLRADVERKDEALLAAYGTMISARQILRDVMYRDTPVPPGRLKTVADSCESTGRAITAALADTADKQGAQP